MPLSCFDLREEVVPLIHTNDPSKAPRNVVQQPFNNRKLDTDGREARRECPPEIMQRPARHAAPLFELGLAFGEAVKVRRLSKRRKIARVA